MVKSEAAAAQFQRDYESQLTNAPKPVNNGGATKTDQLPLLGTQGIGYKTIGESAVAAAPLLKRFHGAVKVNPMTLSSDISKLSEAVIQHLSSLPEAKVEVTIDIAPYMPDGAPENVVRTVTENCRTLRFNPLPQFEEE